jgi:hypothetical protein
VWDGLGAFSRTTNGGTSWITTFFPQYINSSAFLNTSIGYLVGGQGQILYTSNGGAAWHNESSGVSAVLNGIDIIYPSGYIVGENGVILKSTSILPVELVSFSAVTKGNSIEISWVTAAEVNNKGFLLERLTNENWNEISFIEGTGTSTDKNYYSFLDENLAAGNYSYRLTQVDFDGTISELKTVEVEHLPEINFMLYQNYPNPFNPSTKISFLISKEEFVTLEIFNSLGEKISKLINQRMNAGMHEVTFDASDLPSGIYIYKIKAGEYVSSKKLVLLR